MLISGQFGTDGNLVPFTEDIPVVRFGDTLRDDTGMVWAVKDEYDDWVSPSMRRFGIKANMQVSNAGGVATKTGNRLK